MISQNGKLYGHFGKLITQTNMKKLLINWGLKSLNTLIEVSIKDSVVLTLVQLLVGIVIKIIELLTDDDKDNSTQIKTMLKQELELLIQALTKGKEELNK